MFTLTISLPIATFLTHSTLNRFMPVGQLDQTDVASQRVSKMSECSGESINSFRGVLSWDNKPVTMLSTVAQADVTHIAHRKQKDGTRAPVQCTDAVMLYNKYMSGVDKGNQLRQYYRVRMRCYKNYKYIFWFLFDVAITNSYILSLFAPTIMPLSHQRLKMFRLQLAEQLVGDYNTRKRLGCPRSKPSHPPPAIPCQHDDGPRPSQLSRTSLHLPSHMQKKRRCVYCQNYRDPPQRHDILYCKDCPGQPSLCLTGNEDGSDCFRLWHQHLV